jgi:hypothetical protein
MLHLLYRLSLWLLKGLDYFSGSIERHPFFFFTPMDFFHHLSQTTPSGFYIDPFRSIQTQTLIIDVERPKRRQPRRRGRGKGFRRSATPLWYKSNEQPSIASRLLPLDFCTLPVSSYSDRTSSPPPPILTRNQCVYVFRLPNVDFLWKVYRRIRHHVSGERKTITERAAQNG